MKAVECWTYYLQMHSPPDIQVPAPREDLTIQHVLSPTISFYRSLYDTVGEDYNWRQRRKMSDDELLTIIHDPRNELHVLYVDSVPAGFAELDRRESNNEIELKQFGLAPPFIGQGLGKWFLHKIVDKVWSYQPRRFWVHTCTLDHPRALPNYLNAGFSEYNREFCMRVPG